MSDSIIANPNPHASAPAPHSKDNIYDWMNRHIEANEKRFKDKLFFRGRSVRQAPWHEDGLYYLLREYLEEHEIDWNAAEVFDIRATIMKYRKEWADAQPPGNTSVVASVW